MSISLRIKELVDHFFDGNVSKFGKSIGFSEANIRNYINGTQPKVEFLSIIIDKFEINADWLLSGKGEMLLNNKEVSVESITIFENQTLNPTIVTEKLIKAYEEMLAGKERYIQSLERLIDEKERYILNLESDLKKVQVI